MTDFTREVRILAGYDYRDEADKRGADSCALMLILRGELGAIATEISTGWMERPLVGHRIVGSGPQERRNKPGVDAGLVDRYPLPVYVGAHSPVAREGFNLRTDRCDWIDADECWCDGSYTAADRVLEALVSGGSDAAFDALEPFYKSWLVERSAL